MKAIADHTINPWPNGTAFAKVSWMRQPDDTVCSGPGIRTNRRGQRPEMSILYLSVGATLLALAGCSAPNSRIVTTLNTNAALAGAIPMDPLQWRVITSGVDPRNSTMFTLFGNDAAIQYSRTSTARDYPGGSVLALVTWRQQEDSRWFGGKIPAQVKSVEFVDVMTSEHGGPPKLYRAYEGSPLRETTSLTSVADGRAAYVLSLRAAVMP